jgi:hypothetical protein
MYNPEKVFKSVRNFYIEPEKVGDSNLNNNTQTISDQLNLKKLCRPDMNWVYNKCMLSSRKFRNMLDNNYKLEFEVSDFIVKSTPKKYEIAKNQVVNNPDYPTFYDVQLAGSLLNFCCTVYSDNCRKYYGDKNMKAAFSADQIPLKDNTNIQ